MNDLTETGTSAEASRVRDVVLKRPLPESVQRFAIEFGTDSTGDPAVTVWLIVDDDPNPPKRALDQVTRYVGETEDELIGLGLPHWPYIRFIPAREAERFFR